MIWGSVALKHGRFSKPIPTRHTNHTPLCGSHILWWVSFAVQLGLAATARPSVQLNGYVWSSTGIDHGTSTTKRSKGLDALCIAAFLLHCIVGRSNTQDTKRSCKLVSQVLFKDANFAQVCGRVYTAWYIPYILSMSVAIRCLQAYEGHTTVILLLSQWWIVLPCRG